MPVTGYGRLVSVTTGSYQAPEFNGCNPASNLKTPLSAACPLLTVEKIGSSHSPGMPKTGKQSFAMR